MLTTRQRVRKSNLAKLYRAFNADGIVRFSYRATRSESGEARQRPVVRVLNVDRNSEGEVFFVGININRLEEGGNVNGATRTYRLDRVVGRVKRV